MSDPFAGLALPGSRYPNQPLAPQRGLRALDSSDRMLDDSERVREIMEEELTYMSGDGKLLAIAERYQMDDGEVPTASPNWRREREIEHFPLAGILGKTTEVGFRAMIRCVVLGHAQMIHDRQPNGQWVLDSYKIRKGYEGDTRIKVIGGVVRSVPGRTGGLESYGDTVMTEGMGGVSFTPEGRVSSQLVQQPIQRTVLFMDFVFVDIHGNPPILYEDGRPAGEARRTAAEQGQNMAKLVEALTSLGRGNAPAPAPEKAPVKPGDMLEILARTYGVPYKDLEGAVVQVLAKAQEQKNAAMKALAAPPPPAPVEKSEPASALPEPPAPEKRRGRPPKMHVDPPAPGVPIVDDFTTPDDTALAPSTQTRKGRWTCPVCGETTGWHHLAVMNHMQKHIAAGESTEQVLAAEKGWVMAHPAP